MIDEFYDGFTSMLTQMQSVPRSNVHLYCFGQYSISDKAWTCKFELDTPELKIAISRDAVRPDLAVLACFHAWKAMQTEGTAALKPTLLAAPSEKDVDTGLPF